VIKHNLTQGQVGTHLYSMTVPMIWGILSIMSMNIVDTFYVGQLGTNPLTAMSFTIPVISILLSLAFGIGIGTSSVIARAIGAEEHDLVKSYTTQSLLIALTIAIIFAITGYHAMDPIFALLGAPKSLMPLIHQFMDIWFLGSFVVVIPMVGNSAIRAAGNTKLPSVVMISVALVNIILDPILIFGLFGFPRMELAGAALATVISYSIAFFIGLYFLAFKFRFINWSSCYTDVFKHWITILRIAIPAIGTNLIAPISIAITTWLVARYSPESVAGFGVASRVESIFLVVIMSISSIMGPFVGQNWGAGKINRVNIALNISFRFTSIWALSSALLLWFLAEPITSLFSTDQAVIDSATTYLRIMPVTYLFLSIIMISSSTANGIGNPIPSLVMSFLRLIALYIPLALLLAHYFNILGIYLAGAIANILVGVGAYIWIKQLKLNVAEPKT
jgi:putative MATE family efflux protein